MISLSRIVSIVGTNQREQFTVTKNTDGTVHILENKIEKDGRVTSKIYDRVFDPTVTKEVRIYGLSGEINSSCKAVFRPSSRIIGGSNDDEFINEGTGGKVLVYDAAFENNKLSATR
jgi:hypothetical protein